MSKRPLATAIACLFVAPVAVLALAQAVTESSAESTPAAESPQVGEMAPTPEVAVVTETVTVEQTTVAVVPVEQAPAQPRATWQPVKTYAFPQGSTDSEWHYHLPRQLAYLEQRERQLGTMIALGSSFPAGTYGDEAGAYQHLPMQVAHFNRIDQQRLASTRAPAPVAAAPAQPAQESAARSPEEAPSAEVAMSNIR